MDDGTRTDLEACTIVVDSAGIVRGASPGIARLVGWGPDEIIGQHVSVVSPELGSGQEERLAHVLQREASSSYAARWLRRDRSRIDLAIDVGAVRDASGRRVGTMLTAAEVTGDEAARTLLRAVEHSRARFEQVSMPQSLLDLNGRFLEVNAAWSTLFGYAQEELTGRHISALVHPLDRGVAAEDVGRLGRGEIESASIDVLGQHVDGRRLPLAVDATVLRDPAGTPYAVAAFARDLSELEDAQRRLAAQESLFRALSRRSSDAAIVMDPDFNIVYVSPAVTDILGYRQEELLMMVWWELVHPDDVEAVRHPVDEVLVEAEHTERFTLRIRDSGGSWRWVEETLTNCLQDRDIGGLVANLRDVSAEVEAQRATRESEARYRAIVETAQEGILLTDPRGRVVFANDMLANFLGTTLRAVYETDVWHVVAPHGLKPEGGVPGDGAQRRFEVVHDLRDGTQRVLRVSSGPVITEAGDVGLLTMVSDVTATRRAEEELRHKALHDPLTGLPNRYLLSDRLAMSTARQKRTGGSPMSVMFLDLDRFKLVNDSQGHEVGDRLLQEVAARLATAVRATDTVARLGGDEFAVICEDSDGPAAVTVADRIHDALRTPIQIDDLSFAVSASIGIAPSPPLDSRELLRRADVAMYRAKAAGGAGTFVFDGS